MQPMNPSSYSLRTLLLLFVLSISACDGGIFGTGGSDIDIDDASAGTTGSATEGTTGGGTTGGTTGGGTTGSENPPSGTDGEGGDGGNDSVDGFAETVSLINSVATTGRDAAFVRVLNFSGDSVSLSPLSDPEGVIPPNTVSPLLSIPDTLNRIEINSTTGQLLLGALDPVALAAGSLSGVLIRPSTTEALVDVRTYESLAGSDDEGTARVRLIVAELTDTDIATGTSADIEFVPTGDAPTGTRLVLAGQTFTDPVGDYSVAVVGDYSIQTDGQEINVLRLESGASYSLVQVVDEVNGPLLVLVDSNLE